MCVLKLKNYNVCIRLVNEIAQMERKARILDCTAFGRGWF